MLLSLFFIVIVFSPSHCGIVDLNCTSGTAYTSAAVNCDDVYDSAACAVIYASSAVAVDATDERPTACFSADGTTLSSDVRDIAVSTCPKTCGYCCLSKEWNCQNTPLPRIACPTVTKAMCKDPIWREIIAQDCPAACGFCLLGGCIDKAVDCASQPTICHIESFKNFTTNNCQRTCGLCTNESGGNCLNAVDTNPNCASWVRNGFCTNSFYQPSQRKQFCAKSCNVC